MGEERMCDGVVECTALVLAESCTEFEDRLTLFGVLDEIRPGAGDESRFVVYAKFEGCEHAAGMERRATILITDEEGGVLAESDDYPIRIEGAEEPVTVVAAFELPEEFAEREQILWIEAVLEEETLSQTAVRLHDRYSV